jgi:hypothetical protein
MTGQDNLVPSWSGRVLFAHEYHGATRGPVTSVVGLEGHLMVAIGQKVLVHVWNGEKLEGCAFFDAPIYVVSDAQPCSTCWRSVLKVV